MIEQSSSSKHLFTKIEAENSNEDFFESRPNYNPHRTEPNIRPNHSAETLGHTELRPISIQRGHAGIYESDVDRYSVRLGLRWPTA
jgi:hypothetical protein